MSIVFIVANKKGNAGVDVGGDNYFTDCTLSINHTFSNQVTEHAVEEGANFSDHVQVMSNTFSVSGMYNKVSINPYEGNSLGKSVERLQEAYQFLLKLRNSKERFTLVSKFDSYPDCVVSSLSIPVNPDNSNSLMFSMEIKQIRVAKTNVVNIVQTDNVADFKKDDASSASNFGNSNTKVGGNSVLLGIGKAAGIVDEPTNIKPTQ
jgi:hypothetical protein